MKLCSLCTHATSTLLPPPSTSITIKCYGKKKKGNWIFQAHLYFYFEVFSSPSSFTHSFDFRDRLNWLEKLSTIQKYSAIIDRGATIYITSNMRKSWNGNLFKLFSSIFKAWIYSINLKFKWNQIIWENKSHSGCEEIL